MLVINKNSNNTLILTLTEKVTIASPTFLFKLTNDLTRESVLFLSANLSSYKDRYDKFLITETSGTINASSGVINLNPTGYWKYQIFEQASTSNLLESATGSLVENGKIKVIGTDTTYTVYNPTTRKYKGYGTGST
jgi:hypothetical protein